MGKYAYSFDYESLVDAIVRVLAQYTVNVSVRKVDGNHISQILAFMRDRCGVNTKAAKYLLRMYPGAKDSECLAHTLVHPGEHFQLEVLPKFRSDLNLLIKKSTRGKAHYLICVTVSYKKQNVTRWWITYEWYVEVSFKTFCVDSNL